MNKSIKFYDRPDIYKAAIISEMKKLGATDKEIELLSDEVLRNGILNQRDPEVVAWAILQ